MQRLPETSRVNHGWIRADAMCRRLRWIVCTVGWISVPCRYGTERRREGRVERGVSHKAVAGASASSSSSEGEQKRTATRQASQCYAVMASVHSNADSWTSWALDADSNHVNATPVIRCAADQHERPQPLAEQPHPRCSARPADTDKESEKRQK